MIQIGCRWFKPWLLFTARSYGQQGPQSSYGGGYGGAYANSGGYQNTGGYTGGYNAAGYTGVSYAFTY